MRGVQPVKQIRPASATLYVQCVYATQQPNVCPPLHTYHGLLLQPPSRRPLSFPPRARSGTLHPPIRDSRVPVASPAKNLALTRSTDRPSLSLSFPRMERLRTSLRLTSSIERPLNRILSPCRRTSQDFQPRHVSLSTRPSNNEPHGDRRTQRNRQSRPVGKKQ